MEIHEFPDKEFKIIVLKMLRELQESPDKHLWSQKKQYKTKWEVQRDRKRKKEPNGNIELKNMTEPKNSIESFNSKKAKVSRKEYITKIWPEINEK